VGEEELTALKDVIERAWLGKGPKVAEFEAAWSDFLSCPSSVAVNSGTAALHLAIQVFQFPIGKKVLVPAMTFVSTANAALYNRLEPVFVDVDEDTLSIDLEDLDRKCDPDCVAVIPVHFGGHPVKMDELMTWARDKNIKVVSDCAHCAGGSYKSKKLGLWGDIGCFSFEEKKLLVTGDGGMISSNDPELIQSLRVKAQTGMNSHTWDRAVQAEIQDYPDAYHWYYEVHELGFKYNMNDIAAAIGLVQLKKLERMNLSRSRIVKKYLQGFQNSPLVRLGMPYRDDTPYYLFMLRTSHRDSLIEHLTRMGVSTGVHTMPLPWHPLYSEHKKDIPTANRIWQEYVTLPLFPEMTDEQIQYVIDNVMEWKP